MNTMKFFLAVLILSPVANSLRRIQNKKFLGYKNKIDTPIYHASFWAMPRNLEETSSKYVLNTATEISSDELLEERAAWQQNPGHSCPNYRDKWIYIRGDSTTRQIAKFFLTDHGINMNDTELKNFVRSKCTRPPHSASYHEFYDLHKEKYGASDCSVNEKRCVWSSGQSQITYDWQHFVMEEREKFLFNSDTLKDENHDFKDRMPDLLIMGLPVHPCYHTNKNSNLRVQKDQVAEDVYRSQIKDLFSAVRSVYHGPVMWIEAGGVNAKNDLDSKDYMRCLSSMNEELNHVIKRDAASHIIPRQKIEMEFVKKHPEHQGIHKPRECVQQIYDSICSQVRWNEEQEEEEPTV